MLQQRKKTLVCPFDMPRKTERSGKKNMLRVIDCREAVDPYPDRTTAHRASDYFAIIGNADFTILTEKGLTVEEIYKRFNKYPQTVGCKKLRK